MLRFHIFDLISRIQVLNKMLRIIFFIGCWGFILQIWCRVFIFWIWCWGFIFWIWCWGYVEFDVEAMLNLISRIPISNRMLRIYILNLMLRIHIFNLMLRIVFFNLMPKIHIFNIFFNQRLLQDVGLNALSLVSFHFQNTKEPEWNEKSLW